MSDLADELDLPAHFHTWPKEDRIEYFRLSKKREFLLSAAVELATGEERTRGGDRLDKEELGSIVAALLSRRGY